MTITRKKRKDGTEYGWWVRYDFTKDHKPKYQANFNDCDHSSKEKSYNAAKDYENFLIKTYPKVNPKPIFAKPNNKSRSKTGIPGVAYCCRERIDAKGNTYISEYFVASWQEAPYFQKTKQYSIAKHGHKEAFKKAILTRKEAIGE